MAVRVHRGFWEVLRGVLRFGVPSAKFGGDWMSTTNHSELEKTVRLKEMGYPWRLGVVDEFTGT